MPDTVIAANWKMNTTPKEGRDLIMEITSEIENFSNVKIIICPPFTSLATVSNMLDKANIETGAQNIHFEDHGAYTGEISPLMVSSFCKYVILGHSERREHFGETNRIINKKMKAALRTGLTPILCVGENTKDKEQGRAKPFVEVQLRESLEDIPLAKDIIIAYEPIWAIGTGKSATPEIAQDMMSHIRSVLYSLSNSVAANALSLLYGGSVNPDNITSYLNKIDINGALVGGASLNALSFSKLVNLAETHPHQ